jgi:hypothetical protein
MQGPEVEMEEPAPAQEDAAGDGRDAEADLAPPRYLFYHGVIATVNWSRGTGVVRSGNGRDIPFDFQFVTMLGGKRQIEHLLPGMRVGFDVGWTSKGLRITAIKIYD